MSAICDRIVRKSLYFSEGEISTGMRVHSTGVLFSVGVRTEILSIVRNVQNVQTARTIMSGKRKGLFF
jgi:hypothetical protein